jgi:pyruvate formate lyase activating enzyme
MIIAGIQKNSLVDYPGLIACVLFSPGCNYDCFYCHNRSLLSCHHGIINNNSVLSFLKKRAGMIDAVVFTGGEPLAQRDLTDAMAQVRALGYKVKLDTNGSNPEGVKRVLASGLCDYFAVDYKAPAAKYADICGPEADASAVQETVRLLLESGARFEVRTTVIPQLKLPDLMQMARELPEVPRWSLNRYRKPEEYKPCDEERLSETPYLQSEIDSFAKEMMKIQPEMVI